MAADAATYHVSIWDEPEPLYVCLLCTAPVKDTLEVITAHLATVHEAPAIPTEIIPQLLALRVDADAHTAAEESSAHG